MSIHYKNKKNSKKKNSKVCFVLGLPLQQVKGVNRNTYFYVTHIGIICIE